MQLYYIYMLMYKNVVYIKNALTTVSISCRLMHAYKYKYSSQVNIYHVDVLKIRTNLATSTATRSRGLNNVLNCVIALLH